MRLEEEACDLFKQIPKEKLEKLFRESYASNEMDFTFLGFEDIYQKVKKLTTKDMIILDLGCAYATQCWYFKDYAAYIGVDIGTFMDSQSLPYEEKLKGVLQTDNSTFYFEMIQSFIKETLPTLNLDLNKVFAVCSAVPDKEARQLVKHTFPNYLDWYPGEEIKVVIDNEPLTKQDLDFVNCSMELKDYAALNGIDLCIESDPLGFELLVDKYAEMKETYSGEYSKDEIIKDAIDEWNMDQEADLI